MFGLVAALLDGFTLSGFGAALLGALVVSITSWLASSFIGPKGRYEVIVMQRRS
jgi:putative membrane protein